MDPDVLWTREQHDELQHRIDAVFRSHPAVLVDPRTVSQSRVGYLGDPFAPVWFVAENPSLTQVERAKDSTPNSQWNTSPGNKCFREQLLNHGFRTGTAEGSGGWHCYITNVIKSVERAKDWEARRDSSGQELAEWWAPVLRRELELGRPKIVVSVGNDADRWLNHLLQQKLIPSLPCRMKVWHYSYVGMRPRGHRPKGAHETIEEWSAQFAKVVESLRG